MRLPIITTKFIVIGAMVLAIIGGVMALQLVTFTTSNAAFCLSCHSTGETRDMSKQSKVHPSFEKVACVDCHAKPGQFIPEGYRGGFSAEPNAISNNCERCHAAMRTKNTQEGFRFNIANIRIPHKFHIETVGASCTDCHANISHDRQEEPTNRPQMDYCFSCHQGESRSCSKCHPSGLPSAGSGVVKPTSSTIDARELFNRNCSVCHGAKGDQLERANLHSKDFLKNLDDRTLHQVIVDGKGAMPAVSMTQGVNLTEEEVQALIAFVKSLPDAGQDASSAAAQSEGRTLYGTYCSMCHGAKGDTVASANLANKEFLDSRGDEALNRSIESGKGAMPAQGKSGGGPLTDAQISAITAYMKYLAGGATQGAATSAGPAREGQSIYAKNCAGCHGQNGSTLAAANLRSKAFVGSRTDDALQKATAEGKGNMPPFGTAKGGSLSDSQVKEVVEYLKTLAVDP